MRGVGQILCLIRKVVSLLSAVMVILTLVLSTVPVVEAHEAPHQTFVVAAAAQMQTPANCHSYASCSVFVMPSDVSVMTAQSALRLRFILPQAVLLTAFHPASDTPPPRV
jgi:hypothetical protein